VNKIIEKNGYGFCGVYVKVLDELYGYLKNSCIGSPLTLNP
jgi:hypothetical protein